MEESASFKSFKLRKTLRHRSNSNQDTDLTNVGTVQKGNQKFIQNAHGLIPLPNRPQTSMTQRQVTPILSLEQRQVLTQAHPYPNLKTSNRFIEQSKTNPNAHHKSKTLKVQNIRALQKNMIHSVERSASGGRTLTPVQIQAAMKKIYKPEPVQSRVRKTSKPKTARPKYTGSDKDSNGSASTSLSRQMFTAMRVDTISSNEGGSPKTVLVSQPSTQQPIGGSNVAELKGIIKKLNKPEMLLLNQLQNQMRQYYPQKMNKYLSLDANNSSNLQSQNLRYQYKQTQVQQAIQQKQATEKQEKEQQYNRDLELIKPTNVNVQAPNFGETVLQQRESGLALKQPQSADKTSHHQIPNNMTFQNSRQRITQPAYQTNTESPEKQYMQTEVSHQQPAEQLDQMPVQRPKSRQHQQSFGQQSAFEQLKAQTPQQIVSDLKQNSDNKQRTTQSSASSIAAKSAFMAKHTQVPAKQRPVKKEAPSQHPVSSAYTQVLDKMKGLLLAQHQTKPGSHTQSASQMNNLQKETRNKTQQQQNLNHNLGGIVTTQTTVGESSSKGSDVAVISAKNNQAYPHFF